MNALDHPSLFRAALLRLKFGLGLAIVLAAAGCVSHTALDDLPCPCAVGWVCCADQNQCVREGTSCPDSSPQVTPSPAQVRFGGTLELSAGEPVTWSIEEGARGGQITADGRYSAPLRPGPFHLRATSLAHPERTTRVEITVGPTRLELLAGRTGGAGQLDGTGEEARFGEMSGIIGDGAGHLYVTSDYGSHYYPPSGSAPGYVKRFGFVRRVDLATSAVSTVARVEVTTEWSWALGSLAIDAQGKLYSSTGAGELIRIDPVSGAVTTLLPADPKTSLSTNSVIGVIGDWLYFSRHASILAGTAGSKDIARVNLVTGELTRVAGELAEDGYRDGIGADARIHRLNGAVLDPTGAILFADQPIPDSADTPCALRKLDPTTCAVTTLYGLDACPSGMAIDTRGLLYTAKGNLKAATGGDKEQLGVRQVLMKSFSQFVSSPWSIEGLSRFETQHASPLFIDGNTIYAADNPHNLIRRIGPIMTYPQSGYGTIAWVTNLDTFVAGAQAWMANSDGQGSGARFDHPQDVIADSHGNLHVVDRVSAGTSFGRARLVAASGAVRTEGGLFSYAGLAVAANDRLFVMSNHDDLSEITAMGNVDLPVIIRDGGLGLKAFYLPDALTADARAVYVLDQGHAEQRQRIRRYDLATHEVRTLTLHEFGPDTWTEMLASDGQGNVFACSTTKVYRIDGMTGATTEVNLGGAKFDDLTAVAYEPLGILYVADAQHVRAIVESTGEGFDLIGSSAAAGVRTGALPGSLSGISGLAVMPSGELAVSTSSENAILLAR